MESIREVAELLSLDPSGRLLFKGKVPMILTTREFIALIQKTIEEVVGENAAAVIMYRAGFKAGYSFARTQSIEFGVRGVDILRKYLETASKRGWGEFTLQSYDISERIVVEVRGSYGEEWGNVGRRVCHIWRGALAGIAQYIADDMNLKIKMKGTEEKCVAEGSECCIITAEPV